MTTPAPVLVGDVEIPPDREVVEVNYSPVGGVRALFLARDTEVCIEGPAGTGKSLGALQKVHLCALKYPGMRALLLRRTLVDLKATTLRTFERGVLHPAEGVQFHNARGTHPASYFYPNGSEVVIGGMDKPDKVLSAEYDLIFYDEAHQAAQDDVQVLTTRLRNGVMPYQQILMCVNPQYPTHWLNERMRAGKTRRILSRHVENPAIYDQTTGALTERGAQYMGILNALTGVMRRRLLLGEWSSAEGGIYEDVWKPETHLIARREIPRSWPRYVVFDFGFTHPAVVQWWAVDPDGRLYRYREIYRTRTRIDELAPMLKRAAGWREDKAGRDMLTEHGDPMPVAFIADPEDAQARAQLARFLGVGIQAARKDVKQGIQKVSARLSIAGDSLPRLYLLRDSLAHERDAWCIEHHLPCCTEEEVDGYVWQTANGMPKGEEPVKANDHGLDCARYMCMHLDMRPQTLHIGPDIWQ